MKTALCVSTKEFSNLSRLFDYKVKDKYSSVGRICSAIEKCKYRVLPRSMCETDPSFLQIIPYIIIKDMDNGKYLSYVRGTGSDESKLHGKISIGAGGHVDTAPGPNIKNHLVMEAARELEEELGIAIGFTKEKLEESIEKAYYIYTNNDEVSTVHLGIGIIIELPKDMLTSKEEDTITELKWLTVDELKANKDRMELWSSMLIDTLHPVFNTRALNDLSSLARMSFSLHG